MDASMSRARKLTNKVHEAEGFISFKKLLATEKNLWIAVLQRDDDKKWGFLLINPKGKIQVAEEPFASKQAEAQTKLDKAVAEFKNKIAKDNLPTNPDQRKIPVARIARYLAKPKGKLTEPVSWPKEWQYKYMLSDVIK